jgi:Skp family chaperone for outer membrane proteins
MKALLSAFGNKFFLYAVIAVGILGFLQYNSCNNKKHNSRLETYKRQVQGKLTEKERELQKMRAELGISKSELVTQQELAKRLRKDKEEVDGEFEAFKKKHNLIIKSRDRTIASLRQKLKGGTTEVIVSGDTDGCKGLEDRCIISYNWSDHLGRFRLVDSNIFEKDNEIFESEQIFKIYGEIYEQKDGSLQIRRLVLREVYKDESGEYKPIPDAKADIVDSNFQYSNAPFVDEWKWQDLFRLRGIFVGGVEILPNSGNTRFGLGLEFLTFRGIGIGSYTMLDFQRPELISQHISLQYNPTIMDTELNFGVFVSVGTPFTEFFNRYQFNTGLVFYLNN